MIFASETASRSTSQLDMNTTTACRSNRRLPASSNIFKQIEIISKKNKQLNTQHVHSSNQISHLFRLLFHVISTPWANHQRLHAIHLHQIFHLVERHQKTQHESACMIERMIRYDMYVCNMQCILYHPYHSIPLPSSSSFAASIFPSSHRNDRIPLTCWGDPPDVALLIAHAACNKRGRWMCTNFIVQIELQ